ncbi:MAG: hypothetical protein E8D52_01140 [Nitrospira sp.]|nr:MAG: hypothetical protein E8D52_01140 [Nitrospira sp.]
MVRSENSYELIKMLRAIDGWAGLDDELPEGHLDPIAKTIAQVLDQRDYEVYKLIRRYLSLLDYEASPNLGDCFVRLLLWPREFQNNEFDFLLDRKAELLKTITTASMRERSNMVAAAKIDPAAVIGQYIVATPHRSTDLVALMHEVNYTTRICSFLVRLDYQPLYNVIAEMVDPAKTNSERTACWDTCRRLRLKEFPAAAKAVEVVGSNEAKSTVNRFMGALDAAIANFPPTLPAPTAVGAIVAALGNAGNTLSDLRTAITNLPDALAGAITISNIFGADRDDKARQLIGELDTQGWLSSLAFTIKLEMVNWLLSSPGLVDVTTDDEENAINSVMQAAKDYDQAELYQLARAAGWESLYSNVNGDQYDTLENILNQPV